MTLAVCLSASIQAAQPCLTPATWHLLDAAAPRPTSAQAVLADMARREVLLLGEQHDNFDHHRWQLQTLAALHVLRPQMAIGFESFPRRVQPVLDDWIAGKLTPAQFLERVEWQKVWNFPPELYLPLFQFARVNAIPMIALNVERSLTAAIGDKGWDAVPAEQREGVSRPATAPRAYEDYLFEVFKQHPRADKKPAANADIALRNYVKSETTWGRAMEEAMAMRVRKDEWRPFVVGIMGGGHVRHGHSVAHQMRDLGVTS